MPLLQTVRKLSLKYKSTADDNGTPEQQAKFTLSKLLNLTTKLGEYSLEQCSAALRARE